MPINPRAEIEITAFQWVPEGAQGLVKDLRVRWALEEAGLDYRVRLIGGERFPGYLKEQPFNQVPCLRDGDIQIFESGAILQYIGEKSGSLLPADPVGKYRAIQWTYAAVSSVELETRAGRGMARRQAMAGRRSLHHRRSDDGDGAPARGPRAADRGPAEPEGFCEAW